MRRGAAAAPQLVTFNLEKRSGRGEDADPIAVGRAGEWWLAAFDGVGGAGAQTYDVEGGPRTGAYLASRIAALAVRGWIEDDHGADREVAGLGRELGRALGDAAAALPASSSNLHSRMLRPLPTTAAVQQVSAHAERGGFGCRVVWAGDSRIFALRPDRGLVQLSRDHLRGDLDPFENLTADSPLSNYLSADGDFRLAEAGFRVDTAFIGIAASDGCFGYVESPIVFEHLLLDSLQHAGPGRLVGTALGGDRRGGRRRRQRGDRPVRLAVVPRGPVRPASSRRRGPPRGGRAAQVPGGALRGPARSRACRAGAAGPAPGRVDAVPAHVRGLRTAGAAVRATVGRYRLTSDFTTAGGGQCRWAFAERDGREYFIKEYLAPTFPVPGSPGGAATKARKLAECRRFEERHQTLMTSLAGVSKAGGNLVVADDFFLHGARYYKVTVKVDASPLPLDRVRALPRRSLAILATTVAHSVQVLHRRNLVHGDIKPPNVLLKLTAKGIYTAKLIDLDDAYFSGRPVGADELVGDLAYYSPETQRYVLHEASAAELTCAADVFSLGILLTEYLTGARPAYPGGATCATGALSGAAFTTGLETSWPATDQLVRRMLRVAPAERPSSAEVVAALKDIRDGGPGLARSRRPASRPRPRRRGCAAPWSTPPGAVLALRRMPRPAGSRRSPTYAGR